MDISKTAVARGEAAKMINRMRIASKGRRTREYKLLPDAEDHIEIRGDEITFENSGAEIHVFKHRKTGENIYVAHAPHLLVHKGYFIEELGAHEEAELYFKTPDEIRQFATKLNEQADLLEQRQKQYQKELQEWKEAWNE